MKKLKLSVIIMAILSILLCNIPVFASDYVDILANVNQIKDFINYGMYCEAIQECDNILNNCYISEDDYRIISDLKWDAQSRYNDYLNTIPFFKLKNYIISHSLLDEDNCYTLSAHTEIEHYEYNRYLYYDCDTNEIVFTIISTSPDLKIDNTIYIPQDDIPRTYLDCISCSGYDWNMRGTFLAPYYHFRKTKTSGYYYWFSNDIMDIQKSNLKVLDNDLKSLCGLSINDFYMSYD